MHPSRYFALFASVFLLFASALRAQHLLVAVEDGKPYVVVGARNLAPMVQKDGKIIAIHPERFGMVPGGEYRTAYISVRDIHVETSSVEVNLHEVNKRFSLRCSLETDYDLPKVYLALQLKNESGQSGVFLYEVGDLQPQKTKDIEIAVPLLLDNRDGGYTVRFFQGGRELFSSLMMIGEMDLAVDQMIRQKLEGVKDAPARAFVGPSPLYPKALRKQKVEGEAVLQFKIDERGYLSAAKVVRATRSEFGEAALAVIRQWRFLPKVEKGRPVECFAQMPFGFKADED